MLKLCKNLQPPATPNGLFSRALRVKTVKWEHADVIKYWLERDDSQVERGFKEWNDVLQGGLVFVRVENRDLSDIRVGFKTGVGSWSYVGRENRHIAKSEITMNFGWDISSDYDTVLHEIGHSVGFMHEHQHPEMPVNWDKAGLDRWLKSPPNNWSDDDIEFNVTDRVQGADSSVWDMDSIMHYPFPGFVIESPEPYASQGIEPKGGLSAIDREETRLWYPPLDTTIDEAEAETDADNGKDGKDGKDGKKSDDDGVISIDTGNAPNIEQFKTYLLGSELLKLQKFVVKPPSDGTYILTTLGTVDTYAELRDSKGRYVARDNNRGIGRNFFIKKNLTGGREYVLYIRRLKDSEEDSFLVMWEN